MTKCPYCSNELEKGSFRSRGGNYFLPDGEKNPAFFSEKAFKKCRAIPLPPDFISYGQPQYPLAYVCRNCKKIIISYE